MRKFVKIDEGEITKKIKEQITKNQLACLVIIKIIKHFKDSVEMDRDDFSKYIQDANKELLNEKRLTKKNWSKQTFK